MDAGAQEKVLARLQNWVKLVKQVMNLAVATSLRQKSQSKQRIKSIKNIVTAWGFNQDTLRVVMSFKLWLVCLNNRTTGSFVN